MKQDILILATQAFGDKAATLYMRELEKFADLISEDKRKGQSHEIRNMETERSDLNKVHDLVDEMTKNLYEEEYEILRQALTEEFRFWRRSDP